MSSEQLIDLVDRYSAHNYHPLPVVVASAEGVWVQDAEGKRYMDMLAAYSALNFGHRHPALIEACKRQLDRVTLTSRAFHSDQLGPEDLIRTCELDRDAQCSLRAVSPDHQMCRRDHGPVGEH